MDLTIKKMDVIFNNKNVGYLELFEEGRVAFQYAHSWLNEGFPISPFSLPLSNNVYISDSPYFSGLYGVFNDSLPDGWGEFLIRRKLLKRQINFDKISPLTRLSIVNETGLGGLEYFPNQSDNPNNTNLDLDLLIKDINKEIKNESDGLTLDRLYKLGGASGGARPKAHLKINDEDWIVKFPFLNENNDVGLLEYNTNLLAHKCGIDVAPFKLFESKITKGFFGSKRFDRINQKRVHVISLSSILETTHRISNLDYIHLFQVTKAITNDDESLYVVYRRMCFNVFYGNKDDYGKNHSFIYDEELRRYALSKAYDLTKTPEKLEHEMTVNGSGNPTIKDLLLVQEIIELDKTRCLDIINNIKTIIKQ